MPLTLKEVLPEDRPTKSYQQKWCREFIYRDVLSGQPKEVIMGLYNLSLSEYKSLLRNAAKLPKRYFKPLIELTKADEHTLYVEFTSGASEVSLCEKYNLRLNTVIEAIDNAAKEDEEYCKQMGTQPLNEQAMSLKANQPTEEDKLIKDLEKAAKKKLPSLLRGLD